MRSIRAATGAGGPLALIHYRPIVPGRLSLICFPYAGGSASSFRNWPLLFDGRINICCVELPGRAGRFGEPAESSCSELVRRLAAGARRWPQGPFVFFGHSMGALVAFELAREFRRRGATLPTALLVSSLRAPHLPETSFVAGLPDDGFLAELADLSGGQAAAWADPDLRALLLPTLRADVRLCEDYRYLPEDPLPLPIAAFRGHLDGYVSEDEVRAWSQHTSGGFNYQELPGDHMYVHSVERDLVASVGLVIDRLF